MSFNRENVVWESKDGTWNRGFYEVASLGLDSEWDVEYNYDEFSWVSIGHPSEDAAHQSWQGANPGGYNLYSYSTECDKFDTMASRCRPDVYPAVRPLWVPP